VEGQVCGGRVDWTRRPGSIPATGNLSGWLGARLRGVERVKMRFAAAAAAAAARVGWGGACNVFVLLSPQISRRRLHRGCFMHRRRR